MILLLVITQIIIFCICSHIYYTLLSELRVLKENRTSGSFENQRLCIGSSDICPGADSGGAPLIFTSFGQDKGGEIFLVGYRVSGPTLHSTVYQITDPRR